jgi:hypothetical protein
MCPWTFTPSVPSLRRHKLSAWNSFENIIGALMFQAEVDAFLWETPRRAELSGCHRAEFLLRVPPEIYDGFFNSPVGYRAQYALSAELGMQQNRELIDALRSKLIASVPAEADLKYVSRSLDAVEAKIWIDEAEVEEHYFDSTPEIDYLPWLERSELGAGLRCPVGTRLVVYGGWIDNAGRERSNPYKRTRSEDIHACGFT